jgi:hypothetical protein
MRRAADLRPQGESPELVAYAGARPLWRALGDASGYDWLGRRAAHPRERPLDDVLRAGESETLLEWMVPVRLADETTQEITGRTTCLSTSPATARGGDGGVPAALWVAGPLALPAALAGALVLRRRAGAARA